MSDLTDKLGDVVVDALRGETEPIARFGVLIRVPWWRRRIQRYVQPRRFILWGQRRILEALEGQEQ